MHVKIYVRRSSHCLNSSQQVAYKVAKGSIKHHWAHFYVSARVYFCNKNIYCALWIFINIYLATMLIFILIRLHQLLFWNLCLMLQHASFTIFWSNFGKEIWAYTVSSCSSQCCMYVITDFHIYDVVLVSSRLFI